MAAANFSEDEFKILYDRVGEKDRSFRTICNAVFGFNQRKDPLSEKKNKCAWLKIGKHRYCGKTCKDVLCHKLMLMSAAGHRFPLPCFVCGVGVKDSKNICKSCRLKEEIRQRSQLLAKEFEEDWDDEPSVGSYDWHVKKQDANASGN